MIIIKNGIVVIEGDNNYIFNFFHGSINKNGQIYFNREVDTISYSIKHWKNEEIVKDFSKYRMYSLLKSNGYIICKVV